MTKITLCEAYEQFSSSLDITNSGSCKGFMDFTLAPCSSLNNLPAGMEWIYHLPVSSRPQIFRICARCNPVHAPDILFLKLKVKTKPTSVFIVVGANGRLVRFSGLCLQLLPSTRRGYTAHNELPRFKEKQERLQNTS